MAETFRGPHFDRAEPPPLRSTQVDRLYTRPNFKFKRTQPPYTSFSLSTSAFVGSLLSWTLRNFSSDCDNTCRHQHQGSPVRKYQLNMHFLNRGSGYSNGGFRKIPSLYHSASTHRHRGVQSQAGIRIVRGVLFVDLRSKFGW
jgi:hypothetical protein